MKDNWIRKVDKDGKMKRQMGNKRKEKERLYSYEEKKNKWGSLG